jgi:acyl-CoA thioesterase-1
MTKGRNASVVALAALSAMLGHAGSVGAEEAHPTIVTFGDSYINGHGVAIADGFAVKASLAFRQPTETRIAAKLNSALNADGHPVTIVEMGYMATSPTSQPCKPCCHR